MKKLFLIMIMMISACITMYYIVIWQPSDKVIVQNPNNEVNKLNNELNEIINIDKREDDIEKEYYKNSEKDDEIDVNNKSNEKNRTLDIEVNNNVVDISVNEIEKRLSKDEKEKLDRILKRLSAVDLIKIKSNFNKENNIEGIKEGFNIIEKRLSDKEYEEVKELLSGYIDFNNLKIEI